MIFFNQIGTQTHVFASRIEHRKRNPLRVNGDNNDYLTAEIDVLALRQFQLSCCLLTKDFKPVPDGLNTGRAHARKALPKGELA